MAVAGRRAAAAVKIEHAGDVVGFPAVHQPVLDGFSPQRGVVHGVRDDRSGLEIGGVQAGQPAVVFYGLMLIRKIVR